MADNLFKDVFENIHESARTKQVRGSGTAGVSGLMSQSDYTPEGVMHQQTGLARKIKKILRANPKVVKMIRTLPFLHSGDQALIASLSASLRHEVCAKMDTIECIGEVASNFFMIEHGLVLYTSATNNLSDRIQSIMPRLDATNAALSADCNTDEDFEEYLEEGEFWGEVALLFSHTVRRRAVALTHGGLYRLSREHFLRLSEDYPHVMCLLYIYFVRACCHPSVCLLSDSKCVMGRSRMSYTATCLQTHISGAAVLFPHASSRRLQTMETSIFWICRALLLPACLRIRGMVRNARSICFEESGRNPLASRQRNEAAMKVHSPIHFQPVAKFLLALFQGLWAQLLNN